MTVDANVVWNVNLTGKVVFFFLLVYCIYNMYTGYAFSCSVFDLQLLLSVYGVKCKYIKLTSPIDINKQEMNRES